MRRASAPDEREISWRGCLWHIELGSREPSDEKGEGPALLFLFAMHLNLLEVLALDPDQTKLPRLAGVVGLVRVIQ